MTGNRKEKRYLRKASSVASIVNSFNSAPFVKWGNSSSSKSNDGIFGAKFSIFSKILLKNFIKIWSMALIWDEQESVRIKTGVYTSNISIISPVQFSIDSIYHTMIFKKISTLCYLNFFVLFLLFFFLSLFLMFFLVNFQCQFGCDDFDNADEYSF